MVTNKNQEKKEEWDKIKKMYKLVKKRMKEEGGLSEEYRIHVRKLFIILKKVSAGREAANNALKDQLDLMLAQEDFSATEKKVEEAEKVLSQIVVKFNKECDAAKKSKKISSKFKFLHHL